jgi:guanylate kinase
MPTHRPVLAFIGPSGAGKSSVARELHRRAIITVHPTWTRRPPRADETGGTLEHRFISETAFDIALGARLFMATATPFGLPYRYGLPTLVLNDRGPVDAVMLRSSVVGEFTALLHDCVIYQIAVDDSVALRRLRNRGSPTADVTARADDNRREVALGAQLADRIFINAGRLEDVADVVAAALRADIGRVAA